MQLIYSTKMWLKESQSPIARVMMNTIKEIRRLEIPSISVLHKPLYWLHISLVNIVSTVCRVLYWTPIFKSRLTNYGENLYLYSAMPQVLGRLQIRIGKNVRMSGISTLCGRSSGEFMPELSIGDNVDIGWQNSINVGRRIVIGDNVRLAGRVFLAGFPGHPLDAEKRALGLPEEDQQVADIILEKDVWLATGVTVMAGVKIGEGTVVAAGSVVTHSLPAGVVAAGMPAKVIKKINSVSGE